MKWSQYLEQSPRTLPLLYNRYGLDILADPSISQYIPGGVIPNLKAIACNADLAHMAMGMASEIDELHKAIMKGDKTNIAEELADILWYCSGTIYLYKLQDVHLSLSEVADFHERRFDLLVLVNAISEFTDIPKKTLAYRKIYSSDDIDRALLKVISSTIGVMNTVLVSPEQALQNNIDKLRVRFPEKFSEDKALETNRDLDKERVELEKNGS